MNVLAVGCHPDDLEIGCYGTLAKYAARGDKVFTCHISGGDLGHVEIRPDELRKIRRKEAETAAKQIGAESYTLDGGDLNIEATDQQLNKALIEVIRFARPDVIITHNPDDYMRDHQQTSQLVFDASFGASIPHVETTTKAYNGAVPIFYMDTLAGVNFVPTEYVDVTDTIELKLKALACHESQIKWMLDHDQIDFIDFVRTCSKYRGLQSNVTYAEGFRQYAGWPRIVTQRMLP
jgi:LmbE family N-acetylglucosaminyl deacetylase